MNDADHCQVLSDGSAIVSPLLVSVLTDGKMLPSLKSPDQAFLQS